MSESTRGIRTVAFEDHARKMALEQFEWGYANDVQQPMSGNLELLTDHYRHYLVSLAFGLGITPVIENAQ